MKDIQSSFLIVEIFFVHIHIQSSIFVTMILLKSLDVRFWRCPALKAGLEDTGKVHSNTLKKDFYAKSSACLFVFYPHKKDLAKIKCIFAFFVFILTTRHYVQKWSRQQIVWKDGELSSQYQTKHFNKYTFINTWWNAHHVKFQGHLICHLQ